MSEFYETPAEAMAGPLEPNTPCRIMETRPCSIVVPEATEVANAFRYPVDECPEGECARFPNRDKRMSS